MYNEQGVIEGEFNAINNICLYDDNTSLEFTTNIFSLKNDIYNEQYYTSFINTEKRDEYSMFSWNSTFYKIKSIFYYRWTR